MFEILLPKTGNQNEYEELIKVFLRPSEYVIRKTAKAVNDKNEVKRELYSTLSELTGRQPEWGILTGVRPVKLAGELVLRFSDEKKARNHLMDYFLLSQEKADLVLNIYAYQQRLFGKAGKDMVGVYIGIPFCPSRCLYCSFTSNQAPGSKIQEYLNALYQEIEFTGREMKAAGIFPESVYIGGGTPTTLSAEELTALMRKVKESFDLSILRELTVEAGRPDTITRDKLFVLRNAGVNRISINPQSMQEKTLTAIGRSHTPEDIQSAFFMAREEGFSIINMDLIVGLPGEDAADFTDTLREIVMFSPENITVHTLAVKRASKLVDLNPDFHYEQGKAAQEMLKTAWKILNKEGYRPYYLYRQKHMAGSFENIGWCKEDTAGLYNIRIMEEEETIVALGAGGITKVYYPEENRLERVPNVSNYEIYIDRISEMLERKKKNLFDGRKTDVNQCAERDKRYITRPNI